MVGLRIESRDSSGLREACRMWSFRSVLVLFLFSDCNGFFFRRNKRPLPVDGGWSSWGDWSTCYKNVMNSTNFFPEWQDFVVKSRPRFCDSPPPLNGGKYCQGNSHRFKQCNCMNPLGFQNGRIKDSQITASSEYETFTARHGRIGHPSAWCSGSRRSVLSSPFFQVDFINFTKISSISTDGYSLGRVRSFKLKYSLDGKKWYLYKDKYRRKGVFSANVLPKRVKVSRLEKPFVTRYARIEPARYYNRMCMKIEMYGCVFTCGRQLVASDGEITGSSSEIYDQNCLWNIEVPKTTVISLDFVTFDLPCQVGFLDIKSDLETGSESSKTWHKRFCGDNVKLQPYKFSGNNLWLHYFSNSSDAESGFRIRYHSLCRKEIKLNAHEKTQVSTPNYPKDYFHNTQCNWTISREEGSKFFLAVVNFDIETSTRNGEVCYSDFLRIYAINGKSSNMIGNYCNSNKPRKVLAIDADTIMLQFKSDNAISGKGFLIEISNYDPTKPEPTKRLTVTSSSKRNDSRMKGSTISASHSSKPPSTLSTDPIKQTTKGQHVPELARGTNHTFINRKVKNGDDGDSDDTWTVIVIGSFGGVIVMLSIIVATIKIKRYLQFRDALAMQASKAASVKLISSKSKEKSKAKNVSSPIKELLLPANTENTEETSNAEAPVVCEVFTGSPTEKEVAESVPGKPETASPEAELDSCELTPITNEEKELKEDRKSYLAINVCESTNGQDGSCKHGSGEHIDETNC